MYRIYRPDKGWDLLHQARSKFDVIFVYIKIDVSWYTAHNFAQVTWCTFIPRKINPFTDTHDNSKLRYE